jgi:hypothetical protein
MVEIEVNLKKTKYVYVHASWTEWEKKIHNIKIAKKCGRDKIFVSNTRKSKLPARIN